MLVLSRREGQWTTITHAESGDVLRVRVCHIEPGPLGYGGRLNLAFDDDDRHFDIQRPERKAKREAMEIEVAHAMDAKAEAEGAEVAGSAGVVESRGFGVGLVD